MSQRVSSSPILPRSSHASAREEAKASQRGRLLVAMSDVVGEKGYAAATVADVLKASGLARRTFYEHFADKEACFLAAYDHGVGALLQQVAVDAAQATDWRERTDRGIRTFLDLLATEPGFARAFLVEVWAAGPAAAQRHLAALEQFHQIVVARHAEASAQDPTIPPLDEHAPPAVIGGLSRVATHHVLSGRAAELPQAADALVRFALRALGAPA
jgi:AcrR family transcriptional regulator